MPNSIPNQVDQSLRSRFGLRWKSRSRPKITSNRNLHLEFRLSFLISDLNMHKLSTLSKGVALGIIWIQTQLLCIFPMPNSIPNRNAWTNFKLFIRFQFRLNSRSNPASSHSFSFKSTTSPNLEERSLVVQFGHDLLKVRGRWTSQRTYVQYFPSPRSNTKRHLSELLVTSLKSVWLTALTADTW